MFLWRFHPFTRASRRKRQDGQVDWKILIALETLEGFLEGRVADVRSERRAKDKNSILPTWIRRMLKDKEVRRLWIRTHQRPEKGVTLDR